MQNEIAEHTERISRLMEANGFCPDWPVDDDQVLQILDSLEYRIDREKLHRYLAAKYITPPAIRGGKRSWSQAEFISLQCALEMRRQWKPFSRFHDGKKSFWELEKERAEAAGDQQFFKDIDRYSTEDLIQFLVQTNEPHVRQALGLALRTKLEMND